MNYREIKDETDLYSIIIHTSDAPAGTKWYGDESEPMQVCTWLWGKEKFFRAHTHLFRPRTIAQTQEALYVISGRIRCTVVMAGSIEGHTLKAGDLVIHYRGGHGYKVIEDNTKAIEFKIGPAVQPEKDKEYL